MHTGASKLAFRLLFHAFIEDFGVAEVYLGDVRDVFDDRQSSLVAQEVWYETQEVFPEVSDASSMPTDSSKMASASYVHPPRSPVVIATFLGARKLLTVSEASMMAWILSSMAA